MHYFKRNIGDYHKKAGRLSMLQHGAYTLLIDACYDRERFPTMEEAIDWCWASSQQEIEAVEFVLKKFFVEVDGLFVQSRVQDEIDNYRANSEKNRAIAIEREAKRRGKSTVRAHIVNDPPPNQEPITNNQEPLNSWDGQRKIQYEKIKEAFNETIGQHTGKIKAISPARKTGIKARIGEDPEKRINPEWWGKYFDYASSCPHLIGMTPPKEPGGKPWKADFDWLINANNMVKVIEGKYDAR